MTKPPSIKILLVGLLICTAVFIAYSNSFRCPFIFDDVILIQDYSGKSPAEVIKAGLRPVFNAVFLLNQKISASSTWSWHLVNICLQALSSLALFGLVRRTLLLGTFGGRFESSASWISMVSALLWAVHPINTQAVTYITQRGETMVCLFMFLLLYCMVRAETSAANRFRWQAMAVICCCLGLGSKEAMISALPAAVLFDRSYLSSSFKEIWRKNKFLYIALSSIYLSPVIPLLAKGELLTNLLHTGGVDRWSYLLTQTEVVLLYLGNSFCPLWLCFDHDWPLRTRLAEVIAPAIIVSGLLLLSIFAWFRSPRAAFPALFIFICLAPRSSLVPRPDACVDYRFCMPLAAVAVLTAAGFFRLMSLIQDKCTGGSRGGLIKMAWFSVPVLAVITLVLLTFMQNRLYADPYLIWKDTVERSPENSRALNYLGIELVKKNRLDEAKDCFIRSISINPDVTAMNNLATLLKQQGELDEAMSLYGKLAGILSGQVHMTKLMARDTYALVLANMAEIDLACGRGVEARAKIERALVLTLKNPDVDIIAGKYYLAQGDRKRALECFAEASSWSLEPSSTGLEAALVLIDANCMEEALAILHPILVENPSNPILNYYAGLASLNSGRPGDARKYLIKALNLDPSMPMPLVELGILAAGEGNMKEAESLFRKALVLVPEYPEARYNLGMLLKSTSRPEEALDEFIMCGKLRPDNQMILGQIEECRRIISGKAGSDEPDRKGN